MHDGPRKHFVPDGKSVVNRGQAQALARSQPQRAFDLQASVHPDRSWRARRLYRDITDWLAARDPRKAAAIIAAMRQGKVRAYLERRALARATR